MNQPLFASRQAAGERLGHELKRFVKPVVVMSVPRGGSVVGAAVAKVLGAPHGMVVVRRIGAEHDPEWAVGAIAHGGIAVWDKIKKHKESPSYLARAVAEAHAEAKRRERAYAVGRSPDVSDRTVVLVDDGMATGSTMEAAVHAIRARRPARIVVAVPVASSDAVSALMAVADQVIATLMPREFLTVGAYYADGFPEVSDAEARASYLMKK